MTAGRILCALGRHRWAMTRYWAISQQEVEGPECVRCGLLSVTGRRVVG